MNELFLKIINMSISASWLVLVVLILRLRSEESSQMGQCSALGHRSHQIDLPILF